MIVDTIMLICGCVLIIGTTIASIICLVLGVGCLIKFYKQE